MTKDIGEKEKARLYLDRFLKDLIDWAKQNDSALFQEFEKARQAAGFSNLELQDYYHSILVAHSKQIPTQLSEDLKRRWPIAVEAFDFYSNFSVYAGFDLSETFKLLYEELKRNS